MAQSQSWHTRQADGFQESTSWCDICSLPYCNSFNLHAENWALLSADLLEAMRLPPIARQRQ